MVQLGELGVFLHLDYSDLADVAARQLLTIEPPCLFTSTDSEDKACHICEDFTAYGLTPEVRGCPIRVGTSRRFLSDLRTEGGVSLVLHGAHG